MNLLVFALIVVIVAALLIWALETLPISYPLNIIVKVAVILIAAIAICNHAGLLA